MECKSIELEYHWVLEKISYDEKMWRKKKSIDLDEDVFRIGVDFQQRKHEEFQ